MTKFDLHCEIIFSIEGLSKSTNTINTVISYVLQNIKLLDEYVAFIKHTNALGYNYIALDINSNYAKKEPSYFLKDLKAFFY